MGMPGPETQGKVDHIGGRDALVGCEPRLGRDGIKDPVADLGRRELLLRGGVGWLLGLAEALAIRVLVEAPAGLPPQIAGLDHALLDRRRPQPIGAAKALPDAGR